MTFYEIINTKKRILFLSNRGLLPVKDGHTQRSSNILKGLCKKYNVHFLSLYESEEEILPDHIEELESYCEKVEFLPAPKKRFSFQMGIRLFLSFFSLKPYTIWRHYSLPFKRRVDQLISSGQFDLVHCDILPICYAVYNRKDIFCSVTDHDVSYLKCMSIAKSAKNYFYKLFLFLEGLKIKRLEKGLFKKVNLGIAVSEQDKCELRRLCPEGKYIVIENCIDTELYKSSVKKHDANKLVWLGGFNNFSNKQAIIYFLEEIYPSIKKSFNTITFDIVGGGVTNDLLEYSSIDPTINFLGFVEDPISYLHNSAVFVAPILSGGGTKLKVIEAMAAGKAVVTTTIGSEGLCVADKTHLLIADDPETFSECVVELLSNPDLREKLEINSRTFISSYYSSTLICEKLNTYYDQLLTRSSITDKPSKKGFPDSACP